jgi:hypothetical protein
MTRIVVDTAVHIIYDSFIPFEHLKETTFNIEQHSRKGSLCVGGARVFQQGRNI